MVLQHTPLADIGDPPSFEMLPPLVAEVVVMLPTGSVIIVARDVLVVKLI